MDEFEEELRQTLARRTAPPSLKRKVLERRERLRTEKLRMRAAMLQRMAAGVALAAVLGGGWAWRDHEQQRKAEAAREQVMIALRITAHALNEMNAALANHDDAGQE